MYHASPVHVEVLHLYLVASPGGRTEADQMVQSLEQGIETR